MSGNQPDWLARASSVRHSSPRRRRYNRIIFRAGRHAHRRYAYSVWAASLLRADMSFGKDRARDSVWMSGGLVSTTRCNDQKNRTASVKPRSM
jgi:hypothetical protein